MTFTFTSLMTGIVWFVQINHYPLLLKIGKDNFVSYEMEHTKTASRVIAPLMLAEMGFSVVLAFYDTTQPATAITALFLLIMVWVSTFAVQVPLHQKLSSGYNEAHILKLIRTNWLRTAAWTLRLIILASMLLFR